MNDHWDVSYKMYIFLCIGNPRHQLAEDKVLF